MPFRRPPTRELTLEEVPWLEKSATQLVGTRDKTVVTIETLKLRARLWRKIARRAGFTRQQISDKLFEFERINDLLDALRKHHSSGADPHSKERIKFVASNLWNLRVAFAEAHPVALEEFKETNPFYRIPECFAQHAGLLPTVLQ